MIFQQMLIWYDITRMIQHVFDTIGVFIDPVLSCVQSNTFVASMIPIKYMHNRACTL